MAALTDVVDYRFEEGLAVLKIDNPPVNALSQDVREGLLAAKVPGIDRDVVTRTIEKAGVIGAVLMGGGPMHYANSPGLNSVLEKLRSYQRQTGDEFWEPSPYLVVLAERGEKFV